MPFTCSDPQVILARVKVTTCGRVQVDRQRKESTCLGRVQVFFSGQMAKKRSESYRHGYETRQLFVLIFQSSILLFQGGDRLQMTIQIVPGPQRHLRAGVTWCTQDDNRNRGSSMDTRQTMM